MKENDFLEQQVVPVSVEESSDVNSPVVPTVVRIEKQRSAVAQPNNPVRVVDWHFNCDVEPCTILLSKLKEILTEEVPGTPPAHDWYSFIGTAVGLIGTIMTPPFTDSLCIEFWRIGFTLIFAYSFAKSWNAHKLNNSLRRNKTTIITSILKKVKNEKGA